MRHFCCFLLLLTLFFVAACGEAEPQPTPTPQLSDQVLLGKTVFARDCGACHSTAPDTIVVGPSMAGIASRAAERVDGQDAREYLLVSILKPDVYLVEGYENLMPGTLGKTLTGEEVDAVVAYLLTLE